VKAKKHLGQHFLIDNQVVTNIIEAIKEHCPTSEALLEIGPGPGVLTEQLASEYDRFHAVEFDRDMIKVLLQKLDKKYLINEDFLTLDLSTVHQDGAFNLVGNFPYNISSQIVFKMLDHKEKIPCMVGMFQKEVAHRICAKPGTKANGIITLLTQAYYDAEVLFDVGPDAFDPPPKVQSSVILLKRKAEFTLPCDAKLYKSMIKLSFQQRRKKLRNTLKVYFQDREVDPELEAGLLQQRPEHLGVEDFVELTKVIAAGRDEKH